MQQYFISGAAQPLVTITDKDTIKHMFQVMRLGDGDQVVLVFDDGIKYLAKVVDGAAYQLEIVQDLGENLELPVQVTIASGFPKGDKLDFITQKSDRIRGSSSLGLSGRLVSG